MKLSKLFSVIFAVFALVICFAVSSSAARLHGDVNGDGKITSDDARLALRASVSLEKLSDEAYAAADVDGMPGVSSSDARLILRASVKLEALNGEQLPQQPDNNTLDPDKPVAFTSVNVFNEKNYSFDLTDVSVKGDFIRIKGKFKNLSRNTKYYLSLDEIYVNSCGYDIGYYEEYAPGKTGEYVIEMDKGRFEYTGVPEPFTRLEMCFLVGDGEDIVGEKMISVYPYGKKFAGEGDNRKTSSDRYACGDDEFKVSVMDSYRSYEEGLFYIFLYLENNTDKELACLFDNSYVNGDGPYYEWFNYVKPNRSKVFVVLLDDTYIYDDYLYSLYSEVTVGDINNIDEDNLRFYCINF